MSAAVRAARCAAGMSLHAVAAAGGVSGSDLKAELVEAAACRGWCGAAAVEADRRWPPSGLWHRSAAPSAVRALAEDLKWVQDIPPKAAAWAAKRQSVGPGPDIPGRLDRHGTLPTAAAARLASSVDEKDRQTAAMVCSQAESFLLELLAGDPERWVRYYAARNETCSQRTLAHMAATDTEPEVLSMVAINPALPAEALRRLAAGRVDQRRAAALAADGDLLQRLADDRESVVRQAVAGNPACLPGLCEQLALDPETLTELLDNAAVPVSVVETAAAVKRHRAQAATHPNCPAGLLEAMGADHDEYVREEAARHESCPPAMIAQLTRDPVEAVQAAAAANPCCPPDGVRHAAGSQHAAMRSAAAANPCCPPDVLALLASDPEQRVRCVVAMNPSAAAATLTAAASGGGEAAKTAGRALRNRFAVEAGGVVHDFLG